MIMTGRASRSLSATGAAALLVAVMMVLVSTASASSPRGTPEASMASPTGLTAAISAQLAQRGFVFEQDLGLLDTLRQPDPDGAASAASSHFGFTLGKDVTPSWVSIGRVSTPTMGSVAEGRIVERLSGAPVWMFFYADVPMTAPSSGPATYTGPPRHPLTQVGDFVVFADVVTGRSVVAGSVPKLGEAQGPVVLGK